MGMLYRKRESEATIRQMWCPSCLLRGVHAKWRADKPATGGSVAGEDTQGMEQHPRQLRRAKMWAKAARKEGRCSGGVLRGRQWPTLTTGRFRQGRQDRCQLPMDKGHHHKARRSQGTMQAPRQTRGPSLPTRTVQSIPQTPLEGESEGQKSTRLSKRFSQRTWAIFKWVTYNLSRIK